jgi:hypothetical protein
LPNHTAIVHRHGLLNVKDGLETHARPLFTANDLLAY